MKMFVRIHFIFAIFLVSATVVDYFLTERLSYLHENSPSQFYLWQPRISAVYYCLAFGVPMLWFLFAIFHLAVAIRKRAKT